jgi:hypothetical protein
MKATNTFVHPFVLDTFGNRGEGLHRVLSRINKFAIVDKPQFTKIARIEVSFAAHKAAARCAISSAAWISTYARRAIAPLGGGFDAD